MKLLSTIKLSALSILVASAAACGGDGSSVTTKPLSELTDAEFIEACEATQNDVSSDATDGLSRYFCAAFSCESGDAAFEECLEPGNENDCEAPEPDDELRDCDLPANVYVDCLVAYANQYAQFAGITCDDVESLGEVDGYEDIAACDEVVAECPGLVGVEG